MRLRLRLLLTVILALFFRPKVSARQTSILKLTVCPNDVDVSQVTNDRYHAYMDLGRIDFIARQGLVPTMIRKGWGPRSRVAIIRNRHPLKIFQRFELHTSLLCWDDSWFWFKQEFIYEGRTTSIAYSKVGLACKGKMVPTGALFDATAQSHLKISPPWPPGKQLEAIEETMRGHQR